VLGIEVARRLQRALPVKVREDTTAGDTTARDMERATVATISLGQPRRFRLKPTAGDAAIAYPLGRGDLLVMGGTCQRTWRHAIPKVAHAPGPRIAVMFRPDWGY
jgi:alkylated DNA repair dioxygenase AlkB